MTTETRLFYKLEPGVQLPGDWFAGRIPINVVADEDTVIDSSRTGSRDRHSRSGASMKP